MNVSQVFAWMVLSLTTVTFCTAQISNPEIASVDITSVNSAKTASLPAPTEFLVLDSEPVPLNYDEVRNLIRYPEVAREAGFEGMVQVQILVNEMGEPILYRIASSPTELLSEAVSQEVNVMRFEPATLSGNAKTAWVTIPFRFQMQPR